MRILLIANLLLFCSITYSQSFVELNHKAKDLYIQKKLTECINVGLQAFDQCKKECNDTSFNYYLAIINLATYYYDNGNYLEALEYYKRSINLHIKFYGIKNDLCFFYLKNEAMCYEKTGQLVKAETRYLTLLSYSKNVYGDTSTHYFNCIKKTVLFYYNNNYYSSDKILNEISDLASNYYENNDFKSAIICYENQIEIYKLINKGKSSDFIDINSYLAAAYQKNSDYKNAEKYYLISKELTLEYYGDNSNQYYTFLVDFAGFYLDKGDYVLSKKVYLNTLHFIKDYFGEKSKEYALLLNNIGILYMKTGNAELSNEYMDQSLKINKNIYGEFSEEYALGLNNLGINNYTLGNYQNAEKYLLECIKIRKKVLGESNSDYASTKLNLGLVYLAIGNYNSAEIQTAEAMGIFKSNNMQELYATSINNLGRISLMKENYNKAESLLLESLDIKEKIFGTNNSDYSNCLFVLGAFYLIKQDFPKAEKYISQNVSLNKKIYGENNLFYATSLNYLAILNSQIGKYFEAETMFKKSFEIMTKQLGEIHLLNTSPLNGLNYLYEKENKINKADSCIIESIRINKQLMIKNFAFLSMSQTLDFIKSQERNFCFAYSYLSRNHNSDAVSSLFDLDLFIRNTTLYNLDKLELIATKNNDTTFLKKWATYKFYKSTLSKSKPQDNTSEIEKNTETLEKEIMSELPDYNEAIKNNNINWREIQNKLKNNEAVISYVSFRYNSNLKLSDSVLYAAFVLRKDWKQPKYIPVCNEYQLADILEINNKGESIDRLYTDTSNGLYNTIWRPLDSLFIGVKRIYLSPISMLNRISFSAISSPEGGKLIDKYDIQILANVRSIAEAPKNQTAIESAFLFGDIDYNNEPASADKNITYKVSDSASFSSMRSITNGEWGNLNSTGYEVSTIQNITSGSKINTIVFTKQDASEENFKKIISPSILHIATHGFASPQPKQNNKADYFLAETQKNIFQNSIDPLTRSGLVMAGGNQMWQKGVPYPNHEDEILTAKEVSEIDLSGCILATLSACETGLGDVKGSEGVFGLQRAFKMAGVHYLIVSLWKVPDAETADFMQTFYSKWLKDKNEIKDAFRKTQLEMSDKYKEPYKWAGFVLVE